MNKTVIYFIITFNLFLFGCGENKNTKDENYKNLNLTILIDLSDRISLKKNPQQIDRDFYIISSVISSFKNFLSKKGVVQSEDRIKVIFYPLNNNSLYQEIADTLNIDFGEYDFIGRKKIYEVLSDLYLSKLGLIYEDASKKSYYPGSDLFNFFKHRIVDDCIINDEKFINVLVLLTDGYIYDENVKIRQGNRFSYLGQMASHIIMFRKKNNWEMEFEKYDYGLIKLNNDLKNLNLIVAEINPVKGHPEDFDILKKYWSKWFKEQKMPDSNYKILKTDLNYLNRNIIHKFFEDVLQRNNALNYSQPN